MRTSAFEAMVGASPALREVWRQIDSVAATDSTVLIQGETGTGKELVARAIHNRGTRREGPFVRLNVAAIPETLMESELFGHERGAFTGANASRAGRFELAQDGTLFMDEVGELALHLQPKLLRAMQEREIERLGGRGSMPVNARFIAATNRDLASMAGLGQFRPDLYYRLNVFPIRLPPLRERREDIPVLVEHIMDNLCRRIGKSVGMISVETMARLRGHPWPGNVRQLQNTLERAIILAEGASVDVTLPEPLAGDQLGVAESAATDALEQVERAHILRVLHQTNWVIAGPHGAAVRLGLKRTTLHYRMMKLGIARGGKAAIAPSP